MKQNKITKFYFSSRRSRSWVCEKCKYVYWSNKYNKCWNCAKIEDVVEIDDVKYAPISNKETATSGGKVSLKRVVYVIILYIVIRMVHGGWMGGNMAKETIKEVDKIIEDINK